MSKQTTCRLICSLALLVTLAMVAPVTVAPVTWAQAPNAQAPKAKPPVRKGPEDPKLKPRWVSMRTKDNVEIRAFYAPSDKGKDAVPVMVIHEWQGQGSPYNGLVVALHDAGFAVVVPEYRGHGGSRKYTDGTGKPQEFNIATMGKGDIANIIAYDLEEVKQFLKKENNEGKLNLNALTLVGVREGAIFAANWAIRDWNFPSVGRLKQGQDVKGVVMVSPVKIASGVTIDSAIRDPLLLQLPIMIVAGEESAEAAEAKRIGKQIEAVKKRASRGEASGFALKLVPTTLSGAALVTQGPGVTPSIAAFITANVPVSDTVNPWIERE